MNADREFETRLKKYAGEWQVRRQQDGIWYIRGKHCQIQPWSVLSSPKPLLVAACFFKTSRELHARIKLVRKTDLEIIITQQGDTECCFTFADTPEAIRLLKKPLNLYRRKKTHSTPSLRKSPRVGDAVSSCPSEHQEKTRGTAPPATKVQQ